MSTKQNLRGQQAVEKIRQMIGHNSTCMFATQLTYAPVSVRPMETYKADDEGVLWFFSKDDSDKNAHIEQDPRVQLFYAKPGTSEFLTLYGQAEIITDQDKIEELWSPMLKAWFTDGKEDPYLTLIKVVPEEGYYWDTRNNKVIVLASIALRAITGKHHDYGEEGEIKR